MNQEARNKLVEAELSGVKQIKGSFTSRNGQCALGVLGCSELGNNSQVYVRYQLTQRAPNCPFLGTDLEIESCHKSRHSEAGLVIHLNDGHGLSFLDIARKFPESTE